MRTDIVLTLTGPDRVGIVEEVTRVLLELDGNIQTSRMARLGGEFAIIALVTLAEERSENLSAAFSGLVAEGYKLSQSRTDAGVEAHRGWRGYRVSVRGADHEGIIHDIAAALSQRGINIESMETGTSEAPVSGQPLFEMVALVAVPPELNETEWVWTIAESGSQANVDIEVEPAG